MEHQLASLTDDELLRRLVDLLRRSRRDESELVAHIAEVDARRLYAREAMPSMFAYCTDVLHLSEGEAYLRIAVARASREHPVLLTMLGDGRLHLSGIGKLAPHLTKENVDSVLGRVVHRSKREIEELVAELAPRPDVPATMRKLPAKVMPALTAPVPQPQPGAPERQLRPDGVASSVPSSPVSKVQPLAPARYSVQFTASSELRDKLERLRALMRAEVPDGDLGALIEQAVTEKLERLEASRFGQTKHPRKVVPESRLDNSSRHIAAEVKRAVVVRDESRCRFVDAQGRRCPERHNLEFHHRVPFGLGGGRGAKNICPCVPRTTDTSRRSTTERRPWAGTGECPRAPEGGRLGRAYPFGRSTTFMSPGSRR